MKMIINKNPQRYYYGQTNPLKSENPCPLPTSKKHLGKSRGLMAFDLMKTCKKSRFPVDIPQSKIQEFTRPSFDHPKILHILIDRANGVGCKSLAKGHGGNPSSISKFCQSMGFDIIKQGRDEYQRIYEHEWIKEVRSTSKDITWAIHPEVARHLAMKRYYADPDAHNKKCREYSKKNRAKINAYSRKYMPKYFKENPSAKIAQNLRIRLNKALKSQLAGKKVSATDCGCSMDFLVQYLEQRFKDGMTWDNYGLYGWHIDHIKPCASFDLTKKSEQRKCCHYTNLQPMWAEDNLCKSDKIEHQQDLF